MAQVLSSTSEGRGTAVHVDEANDAAYYVGVYEGTLTHPNISSSSLMSSADENGLLVKSDLNGSVQWGVAIGRNQDDALLDVTTDQDGNVYVTGYSTEQIQFRNASPPMAVNSNGSNRRSAFVAKYSPMGNYIWHQFFPSGDRSMGLGVEVLNDRVAVLVAYDDDGRTFDPGSSFVLVNSSINYAVMHTDLGGSDMAIFSMGSDADDFAKHSDPGEFFDLAEIKTPALSTDGDALYLALPYRKDFTLYDRGANVQAALAAEVDDRDALAVVRTDLDGVVSWANRITIENHEYSGIGIDVDCHGVYVGAAYHVDGNTMRIHDQSGVVQVTGSEHDAAGVVAFDRSDGSHLWHSIFEESSGSDHNDIFFDVAADDLGVVHVLGGFEDPLGTLSLTSAGGTDVLSVTLENTTGDVLDARRYGNSQYQTCYGVDVSASGRVFLTGHTESGISVGVSAATASGVGSMFVAMYGSGASGGQGCCIASGGSAGLQPSSSVACPTDIVELQVSNASGPVTWSEWSPGGNLISILATNGPMLSYEFYTPRLLCASIEDECTGDKRHMFSYIDNADGPSALTLPSDIIVDAAIGEIEVNVSYSLVDCGTVDVSQTEGLASGEAFPIGQTTNTFAVTDMPKDPQLMLKMGWDDTALPLLNMDFGPSAETIGQGVSRLQVGANTVLFSDGDNIDIGFEGEPFSFDGLDIHFSLRRGNMASGETTGLVQKSDSYSFQLDGGDIVFRLEMEDPLTGDVVTYNSTSAINTDPNVWHDIQLIVDPNVHKAQVFVDGVELYSDSIPSGYVISHQGASKLMFFGGLGDEVEAHVDNLGFTGIHYKQSREASFIVTVNDSQQPQISGCVDRVITLPVDRCDTIIDFRPIFSDNSDCWPAPQTIPGYNYIGELNGHTYYATDSRKGWEEAQNDALAMGGYLATITSQEEHDLLSFSAQEHWIGATDRDVEGDWKWVNGEPFTYTNWATDEPSNTQIGFFGQEHLAAIAVEGGEHKWVDRSNYTGFTDRWAIIEFGCAIEVLQGEPIGTAYAPGVYDIELRAYDPSGNVSDACAFELTIEDVTSPTLTCPPTQTLEASGPGCETNMVMSATATDACGISSSEYSITGALTTSASGLNANQDFPIGMSTIEWRATDTNGLTGTCTTEVVVTESSIQISLGDVTVSENTSFANVPVTLTAPPCSDVTIQFSTSGSTATAGADFTSLTTINLTIPAGATSGTISVPIMSDALLEGNETFTVFLNSVDAPAMIMDGNATVTIVDATIPELCSDPVDTLSENGATTIAHRISILPLGSTFTQDIIIEYSVLAGGTASSLDFAINGGQSGQVVIPAGATHVDLSFEMLQDTINEVTEYATIQLVSGSNAVLASSCDEVELVILDDDAPYALCLDTTIYLDDSGQAVLTAEEVSDTDIISGTTLSIDLSTFDCSDSRRSDVVLTATDIDGSTSCTAQVILLDTIAPLMDCPGLITLSLDSTGQVPATFALPTATDNCGNDLSIFNDLRYMDHIGRNGVFYSENSGTWSEINALAESRGGRLVLIGGSWKNDWLRTRMGEPAMFIGLSDSLNEGDWLWTTGAPLTYANWGTEASVMQPDNAPLFGSETAGCVNCGSDGAVIRSADGTWDDYENDFISRGIIEFRNDDRLQLFWISGPKQNDPITAVGQTTATYIAMDASGNTDSCEIVMNVIDEIAPWATTTLTDQTQATTSGCTYTTPDYAAMMGLADNYTAQGDLTIAQTPPPGTALGQSIHNVIIEVSDESANISTFNFQLTVLDTESPTFTCIGDQTRNYGIGCEYQVEDFTSLVTDAFDNCGMVTITQVPAVGEIRDADFPVTLTVSDGVAGNEVICTFDVFLQNRPTPTADAGTDIVACCGQEVNIFGSAINAINTTWIVSDYAGASPGTIAQDVVTGDFIYEPTDDDCSRGWVELQFTAIGEGSCGQAIDMLRIDLTAPPSAGDDIVAAECADVGTVSLFDLLGGAPEVGGTWTGATSTTAGHLGTIDVSTLTPGIYNFTYTVAGSNGCADDSAEVTFEVRPLPSAGPDVSATLCSDLSTYSLFDFIDLGAYPGGDFALTDYSSISDIIDPSSLGAGNHNFLYVITDPDCGTDEAIVEVIILAAPAVDAGPDITACCGETIDLALNSSYSNNISYTWAPLNALSATGSIVYGAGSAVSYEPDADDCARGYAELTLTVAGQAPCNSVTDILRIDFVSPPEAGTDNDTTICSSEWAFDMREMLSPDAATGGVFADASTGVSYVDHFFNATDSLNDAYEITYTTTTGSCTDEALLTITIERAPTAWGDFDKAVCDVNTVAIDGFATNGIVTWTFDPALGSIDDIASEDIVYTPIATSDEVRTDTLIMTVSGAPTCAAAQDIVLVEVNPAPDAGADITIERCSDSPAFDLYDILDPATDELGAFVQEGLPIPNSLIDPSTLTAGVHVFYYKLEQSSCLADSAAITLRIDVAPEAGVDVSSEICLSGNPVELPFLLDAGHTTGGTWVNVDGAIGLSGQTYTPGADAQGVYAFEYVTPAYNGCLSDTAELLLTVTPDPSAGPDVQIDICASQSQFDLYTFIGTGIPTDGIFFYESNDITSTASAFTHSGAANYDFVYQVSEAGCAQIDAAMFRLNVQAEVDAGSGQTEALCESGAPIDVADLLSPSAAMGGNWSNTAGVSGTVFDPADHALGQYTFTYELGANGECPASAAAFVIDITSGPSAGDDAGTTVCADIDTVDLSAQLMNADPGGVYVNTNDGEVVGALVSGSSLVLGANEFYYIVAATGCANDTALITIQVIEAPQAGTGQQASYCESLGPVDLTTLVTGPSDAFGSWVWLDDNASGALSGSVFDVTTAGVGAYELAYIVSGTAPCEADTAFVGVFVTTGANAGGDNGEVLCSDAAPLDLTTLILGGQPGGTFYSTESMTTVSDQFDPNAYGEGVHQLLYIVSLSGCDADSATFSISVEQSLTADAGADQGICAGSTLSLSGASVSTGSAISWSSSTGGSFSDASLITPVYTPSSAAIAQGVDTLTLTATGTGVCPAVSDQLVVTIETRTVDAGTDLFVCPALDPITLSGIAEATSVSWSVTTGQGNLTDANALAAQYTPVAQDFANGQVVLTLTAEGAFCAALSDEVAISFQDTPVVDAGEDLSVCGDGAGVMIAYTASSGAVSWATSGTGTFSDLTSTTVTYTPTDIDIASGGVVLSLQADPGNGCVSVVDEVTLTLLTIEAPSLAVDYTGCAQEEPVLSDLEMGLSGIQWYSDGAATTSISSNSLAVDGMTYYATTTVDGCESTATSPVTVSLQDPAPPTIPAEITFCPSAQAEISDIPLSAGAVVEWYDTPTAGTPIATTATLADGVTYYAAAVEDGCISTLRTAVTARIEDNEPPILAEPELFLTEQVDTDCAYTLPNYATMLEGITDNCSGAFTTIQTPDAGTTYTGATPTDDPIEITLVVRDQALNESVQTMYLTLVDEVAPEILCPGEVILTLASGQCEVIVTEEMLGLPNASDACGVQVSADLEASYAIGEHDIVWTAIDASGNSSTCSQSVMVSLPLPNVMSTQTYCESQGATIADVVGTSTDVVVYDVENGGTPLASSTALIDGGTYYAAVDHGACVGAERTPITVDLVNVVAPEIPSVAYCTDEDYSLADISQGQSETIIWYGEAASTLAIDEMTVVQDGDVFYAAARVADCESTERTEVTISIGLPAAPTGAGTATYCMSEGAEVRDLDPLVTDSVAWSLTPGGAILSDNEALESGLYYAYTQLDGCLSADYHLLEVSLQDVAPPLVEEVQSFCDESNAVLADLSVIGEGLRWYADPTDMQVMSTDVMLSDGGTYYVTATIEGCESTARSEVQVVLSDADAEAVVVEMAPIALADKATLVAILPEGETGQWSVVSGQGILLDPNSPSCEVINLDMGVHEFMWTVTNGSCDDLQKTLELRVNDLHIPKGFSPNGDGTNDDFVIKGITQLYPNKMTVFDRLGRKVFEQDNYDNTWGGERMNGSDLPADTYFIILNLPDRAAYKSYIELKK